jgi:hypothetical protein
MNKATKTGVSNPDFMKTNKNYSLALNTATSYKEWRNDIHLNQFAEQHISPLFPKP